MSAPPDELANMFGGLQMNEGGGADANPFLPFVQGMMQSLLSAEVLLPSLTDLLEKYPVWLAENGDKIDAADKERYMKQQELFQVICADLRQEKPDDSAETKNTRFKRVLENMQKVRERLKDCQYLNAVLFWDSYTNLANRRKRWSELMEWECQVCRVCLRCHLWVEWQIRRSVQ